MADNKIRTMEEFAVASGLSRPTVSKYFDNPESVKPSTRARIEKALKDHNYQPNIFAVSMNRKKPKNIGVIVPHISDPFYAEIIRQIEMRCLAEGYWTIVLSSHGDRKLEARAMRTLMSLNISGVLMAPLGFETDAKLLSNLSNSMPVVFSIAVLVMISLLLARTIARALAILSSISAAQVSIRVSWKCLPLIRMRLSAGPLISLQWNVWALSRLSCR